YYYNKAGQQSFHSGLTTIDISTINKWHRVSGNLKLNDDIDFNGGVRIYIYAYDFTTNSILYLTKPQLEEGTVATTFSLAQETIRSEIAEYKRTADKNYAGLQSTVSTLDGKVTQNKTEANQTATQLSNRLTSLETYKDGESTRAQAYFEASKAETAKQLTAERTAISANYVAKSTYDENVRGTTLKLNEIKSTADNTKQNLATYQNTVDGKLEELTSSTQTLDGEINTASAKITQNAQEISKRLTSTQVDKAITDKGYQTKSDVDNNITGRGYITSSALQPYALATTVQNLVQETADSFSRTISETKALIPTEVGGRNYLLNSKTEISGGWGSKVISLSPELLDNLNKIKSVTISCDVEGTNVATKNSRKRYGLACSVEINGIVNYWEVWQAEDTSKKRISQTFTVPEGKSITKFYSPALWIQADGDIKVSNPKIEFGVLSTDWSPAPEDLATVTALHTVNDTVDSHTRIIGAVGTNGSILDNISKVTQTAAGLVQEVSGTNGLKTQVGQLKNSWAVKISGPEGLKTAINASTDGVRLKGKNLWLDGNTLIDNAVITSAMIAGLDAGKITTGYLDAARIRVGAIDGSKIAFDEAFFNGLTANQAYLKKLFAKDAFITSVQAVSLSASQITSGSLKASNNNMAIHLDEAEIEFKNNAKIRFLSSDNSISRTTPGLPKQFLKFETGEFVQYGKTNLASRLVLGSNSDNVENAETDRFSGQRWWQARDGASMGELVANQVLIYSNGTHRGPLVFNTGGSVKSIHPTAGSSWDIGLNEAKFRYMHVYDIYLQNGTRLGRALKDLANRVGHNGWADNLS
ncbi:gp58-like family protein, partial [Streptococcus suis]